ncbi:MAG: hypothetical protein MUC59_17460 [Saprospiraceae bacterium]|nr:hypothetical protein [Saprospiraceae bacterium]
MQKLFLALFFLELNVACGQQLIFRGYPLDTISIFGSAGYYHFDEKGTTTGREDVYVIAFDNQFKYYKVVDCKRNRILNTIHPDTSIIETKHFYRQAGKQIPTILLDNLCSALNSKMTHPIFSSLFIQEQDFFSLVDKKHILEVAKRYKEDWQFKRRYSSREENKILYKGCQNIDTFNLFLTSRFDTSGYVMVTDVWDEINISIKTANQCHSFEGKYPNPFRQPWYEHSLEGNTITILNLDINRALVSILPDKFYRKDSIAFPELIKTYIKWYLQRRDIISYLE